VQLFVFSAVVYLRVRVRATLPITVGRITRSQMKRLRELQGWFFQLVLLSIIRSSPLLETKRNRRGTWKSWIRLEKPSKICEKDSFFSSKHRQLTFVYSRLSTGDYRSSNHFASTSRSILARSTDLIHIYIFTTLSSHSQALPTRYEVPYM